MRCPHLFSLVLLVIALSLSLASDFALASAAARHRRCRRALYLSSLNKRDETRDDFPSSSLFPRLWRNSELPVPLALNRQPPPRPAPPPSSSWSGGTSKHTRPLPPTVSSILAGNPSQAKTRKERRKEVVEKKKQYENIRAGHAFVDMIIDECGAWLKKELPPRPKTGKGQGSGQGSSSGPAVARIPI